MDGSGGNGDSSDSMPQSSGRVDPFTQPGGRVGEGMEEGITAFDSQTASTLLNRLQEDIEKVTSKNATRVSVIQNQFDRVSGELKVRTATLFSL